MPEYAVFLELYFIRNSAEDTDLDEISEEEMMARNHSFDYTDNNIGDIMEYVKTFSPYEVADNFCGLYDIVEGSEKWIHTNDGKLTLTFHIKLDKEETIEEIRDMFLNDSLEDGPYEGEDNGWVISTLDKKYEYGLIDFRNEKNIAIIPVAT